MQSAPAHISTTAITATEPETLTVNERSARRITLMGAADVMGASLSFACALHCLLLPVLLTVLPVLGLGFLADHEYELIFIAFTGALALANLCWGSRIHRKWSLILLPLVGLTLFGMAHVPELGGDSWLKAVLLSLGGLSIASGHLLNRRLCRTCRSCHAH